MSAKATFRYDCSRGVTGLHYGIVDANEDMHAGVVDVDGIAELCKTHGLGKGSIDVVEAIPCFGLDAILSALGNKANSLGRFNAGVKKEG